MDSGPVAAAVSCHEKRTADAGPVAAWAEYLSKRYHGHEEVKAKLTPQVKAWLAIHCKSTDNPRAFEDFAVGLQVWMPKSMLNCPTG